ncbi:hypothetical protein AX14_007557 [Amanita brunnescens Koide BX004]|nr:hypothetical protein AX14_007557 [Amanita brunnescens Koide BX004]
MSYLQLSYFSNHDRPPIQHPEITSLPVDILGPAIAAKVDESLRVSTSDMPACAASARLWEDLLEQHRIPYLLVRVADMRWALDNKFTALVLYEELHAALQHTDLGKWIITAQSSAIAEAERQLHNYLHDTSLGFTASQRWRPTAGSDVFPYFKLQRIQINAIRNEWMNMESPETIMEKFLNLHCLETNVMEGTVQFDESASTKLVQVGFFHQVEPVDEGSLTGGAVRSRADALSILRDTHNALREIFNLLKADPLILTVEVICRLHRMLMSTSRVLYIQTPHGRRLSYLNIGVTRQFSRINVTALSRDQNLKIQFCPYDEVDAELSVFCERFNQLIRQADMDPFAAAAWISHVFVTIHPFEACFP